MNDEGVRNHEGHEAMKKRFLSFLAMFVIAAAALLPAQAPKDRGIPTFEVDRNWPKVPAQWKLGDPSSFAIDAQDRVWLLHRPRTLVKPEDVPKRAPAVMVFDTAGTFIKGWGGDPSTTLGASPSTARGAGSYEWPQREHGINVDSKGFVWITGNNCPTNGIANLKHVADDQILKFTQDGKFVMQIGHSNQKIGRAHV